MTPSFTDIDRVEQDYLGPKGRPVLGLSFGMLMARWQAGERDRETALRLLFLSWYAQCESPMLTGLDPQYDTSAICTDAFAALGGADTQDPEVCFVVGLMAELFPWCLGDEVYWADLGRILKRRAVQLQPSGLLLSVFGNRGAYGEYFSHMFRNASLP